MPPTRPWIGQNRSMLQATELASPRNKPSECTLRHMWPTPARVKVGSERSDRRRQRMGSHDNRPESAPAPGSSPGCRYAIRVEGLMDAHWSQWLDGMTITHEAGGITRLEGPIVDQAALHGLLNKLRDLRLTLLTV